MKMNSLALALSSLFIANSAFAAITSGDFRTESNLPDYRSGTALVYEHLNAAVDNSVELNNAHLSSNPDGWGGGVVWLDLNPSNNILTLHSQDTWDFQTFSAKLSNLTFNAGERITGISWLGGNLVNVGLTPTLSFTNNSVSIAYDYRPGTFNFTGGSANFQLVTAPVPEPETYALMGMGLLGLLAARKRKKA
jgi:hypothetical protein